MVSLRLQVGWIPNWIEWYRNGVDAEMEWMPKCNREAAFFSNHCCFYVAHSIIMYGDDEAHVSERYFDYYAHKTIPLRGNLSSARCIRWAEHITYDSNEGKESQLNAQLDAFFLVCRLIVWCSHDKVSVCIDVLTRCDSQISSKTK